MSAGTFKHLKGGLPSITKHLEVCKKILGFALYFKLLSVFGNRRKSCYSFLNYYLNVSHKVAMVKQSVSVKLFPVNDFVFIAELCEVNRLS